MLNLRNDSVNKTPEHIDTTFNVFWAHTVTGNKVEERATFRFCSDSSLSSYLQKHSQLYFPMKEAHTYLLKAGILIYANSCKLSKVFEMFDI